MRSPLDTLHTMATLSLSPDAKYSPSGENATLLTGVVWPLRVLIHSQLDTFHTWIIWELRADAKYSPSGENTAKVKKDS